MPKDRFNSFGRPIPKGSWGDGFIIEKPIISKEISCAFCDNYDEEDKSCTKTSIYPPIDGYSNWKTCRYFYLKTEYDTAENQLSVSKQRKICDYGINIKAIDSKKSEYKKNLKINWYNRKYVRFTEFIVKYVKKYIMCKSEYQNIDIPIPFGFNLMIDIIDSCNTNFLHQKLEYIIIHCYEVMGIDIINSTLLKDFLRHIKSACELDLNDAGQKYYTYSGKKVMEYCIAISYRHLDSVNLTKRFDG